MKARLTTKEDLTPRAKKAQRRHRSWDQENGGRGKEQRADVSSPRVSGHIKE